MRRHGGTPVPHKMLRAHVNREICMAMDPKVWCVLMEGT